MIAETTQKRSRFIFAGSQALPLEIFVVKWWAEVKVIPVVAIGFFTEGISKIYYFLHYYANPRRIRQFLQ